MIGRRREIAVIALEALAEIVDVLRAELQREIALGRREEGDEDD